MFVSVMYHRDFLSEMTLEVFCQFSGGHLIIFRGFSGGSLVKNLPANAGGMGLIPGSGRYGEGNGNPPQYSCLRNPMDRGAWWVTVHGVTKSRAQLSD